MKLKANQTPVYNLVRSLGLVGPLPEATAPETRRRPPKRTRAALAVLRIFMARFAAGQGMHYLTQGYASDIGLVAPGQVKLLTLKAPALVYSAAMAPPYFFCAFLLIRDLLTQIHSTRWRVAAVAAIWFLQVMWEFGMTTYMASNNLADGSSMAVGHAAFYIFGWLFVVPCLAAASAISLRRGRKKLRRASRVALLYERYLGLRGLYYRWKVLGLQYLTIVLQAATKLPDIGALVWTESRFRENPIVDFSAAPSAPTYWFFVIMLVFNAIYPGALYYYASGSSAPTVNRTAALCDVTLDLSYSLAWVLVTKQFMRFCRWTPVTFFGSLGLFTPVVHLLFTCRAVEAAAADERPPASAAAPSKRACAGHALLSFATLTVIMVASCSDRYPFKARGRCNPCECEGTVLKSCKVAGDSWQWSLELTNKGITAVDADAFQDVKRSVYNIWLSDNPITVLPRDVFKGLDLLMTVSLSRTDIAELPSFEDKKYYENLFIDGIPNLASLDDNLAGSTVRWVHATNLPNFALDVSSFARTRQLEAVWVGGSTTCNVTLPHEAACIDHRCNFVGHLTADTFIDRIFNKGTCQNPYEIVPGCGHLPCFPRSCTVPA